MGAMPDPIRTANLQVEGAAGGQGQRTRPGRTRINPARAPHAHWSMYDYGLVLLGFLLSMAVSLWLGHNHIFWEDEMLGWMMLRDPSWSHMFQSWKHGADGGGILFYVTGRLWFALVGASAKTFRLYSALSFAIAFAFTWASGRRMYRIGPVAFAMFNTWFFCPVLVAHIAEGRFYGLLMASVALAVYLYLYGTDLPGAGPESAPAHYCALVCLAHALLITSHLLGVVYSAFIVLGTLLMDLLDRRIRPRIYLSALAAWLLLIPSRQSIIASAQVGKPHFWTRQPTLPVFVVAYTGFSLRIAAVMLLLLAALAASLLLSRKRRGEIVRSALSRKPIYVITLMLMLVPIAFLVEGIFGPALFIDRYLIPVNIAVVFIQAEAITLLKLPRWIGPEVWKPALAVFLLCFAAAIAHYDFAYVGRFIVQPRNYTDDLTAIVPKGIPVLCEDAFSFTELMGRQRNSGALYIYLLDWDRSISPGAPRLEVTQFHLMENWKKAGYFSDAIVYRDQFLQQHPYFLVLHTEELHPARLTSAPAPKTPRTNWLGNPLVERFAADPDYQVKPYKASVGSDMEHSVWLVCRRNFTPCDVNALEKHS